MRRIVILASFSLALSAQDKATYIPAEEIQAYLKRVPEAAGAVSDPTNTIVSVKRLMGRGLADVSSAGRLAYDFVESAEGMVRLRTAAGVKSPVEVSAEILATLRQRAEDTFGAELHHEGGVGRRKSTPGTRRNERGKCCMTARVANSSSVAE